MSTILFRFLVTAMVFGSTACEITAQTLTCEKTVPITHGNIWCIPVYDGREIVVSAESNEGIRLAKYDLVLGIDTVYLGGNFSIQVVIRIAVQIITYWIICVVTQIP